MDGTCKCGGHGAPSIAATRTDVRAEQTVGEVARRPGPLAVMQRLGLDHCCGASLILGEAAASAGIPLAELLAEIEKASAP